ncbi:hypothetical protein BDQ17DRAFT_1432416 [Cyathus striatus]|nr:hypothetical protein BDQ17DRAFT_1432416 [Cyathus striatus]
MECSFLLDDPSNVLVPNVVVEPTEVLAMNLAARLPVVLEAQRALQFLTAMANIQTAKYSFYLLDYIRAFRDAYQKLGDLSGLRAHGVLASDMDLTQVIDLFRLADTVKEGLISPTQLLSMEAFFIAATGAEIQAMGVPSAVFHAQTALGINQTQVPRAFYESIAQYDFALPRRSDTHRPGTIDPRPWVRAIRDMSIPFGQVPVQGSGTRGNGSHTNRGGHNGHGSHSQRGGHRAQPTRAHSVDSDSVPSLVTINND